MRAIEDLTRLGRLRRCRKLMVEALKSYDIEVDQLVYLTEATNIFYKVIGKDQSTYVMKLYEELSSNMDDSLVEVHFLNLVKDHTDVEVPEVVLNKDKNAITLVEKEYENTPKRFILYKWKAGKDYEGYESLEHFKSIGEIMGKLHNLTEVHEIPEEMNPKKINKVFYYAGDEAFYLEDKHKKFVSKRYKHIMKTLQPILDKQLAALYEKDNPIMIHGDFNSSNIRIHKNQIHLLDFEDTSLGFPVHDIAIMFYYYRYDEKYHDYKKAFYKGYHSVRKESSIDETTVEMIMAARDLNFLNYILEVSEDPSQYIERSLKRLEVYMDKNNIAY
jgi:Ser/Thr protein kinase RdoA (MazF antagonist)